MIFPASNPGGIGAGDPNSDSILEVCARGHLARRRFRFLARILFTGTIFLSLSLYPSIMPDQTSKITLLEIVHLN